MHIFKYSKREGTVAAGMPDQVADQIKTVRSNELLKMEKEQSADFRRRLTGHNVEVLVEEDKEIDGVPYFLGHTKDYVKVAVPAGEKQAAFRVNDLITVQIERALTDEILLGRL